MALRIISRLVLLLVALAAVTTLVVGGLSVLASMAPDDAASFLARDQAAAVERSVDDQPADEASGASPTPAVVLVFAGIVLMAALPPVNRVYVYHRPYHRYDWP
jgi:hypothetical protein